MVAEGGEAKGILQASARLWRSSPRQQTTLVVALAVGWFLGRWSPSPLFLRDNVFRPAHVDGLRLLTYLLFPAIQGFYLHAMIRAAVPAPARWTLRGALPALAAVGTGFFLWPPLAAFLYMRSAASPLAGLALTFGGQTLTALALTWLGPWAVGLADPSLVHRRRAPWWRLWVAVAMGLLLGGWTARGLSLLLQQISAGTAVPDHLWLLPATLGSYIACQAYLASAVILVQGFRTAPAAA